MSWLIWSDMRTLAPIDKYQANCLSSATHVFIVLYFLTVSRWSPIVHVSGFSSAAMLCHAASPQCCTCHEHRSSITECNVMNVMWSRCSSLPVSITHDQHFGSHQLLGQLLIDLIASLLVFAFQIIFDCPAGQARGQASYQFLAETAWICNRLGYFWVFGRQWLYDGMLALDLLKRYFEYLRIPQTL